MIAPPAEIVLEPATVVNCDLAEGFVIEKVAHTGEGTKVLIDGS